MMANFYKIFFSQHDKLLSCIQSFHGSVTSRAQRIERRQPDSNKTGHATRISEFGSLSAVTV